MKKTNYGINRLMNTEEMQAYTSLGRNEIWRKDRCKGKSRKTGVMGSE